MFETLLIILAFAFYSLFSNAISKTVLTLPLFVHGGWFCAFRPA